MLGNNPPLVHNPIVQQDNCQVTGLWMHHIIIALIYHIKYTWISLFWILKLKQHNFMRENSKLFRLVVDEYFQCVDLTSMFLLFQANIIVLCHQWLLTCLESCRISMWIDHLKQHWHKNIFAFMNNISQTSRTNVPRIIMSFYIYDLLDLLCW